jgi:D-sedoheptulose 7-phosphate isomerase
MIYYHRYQEALSQALCHVECTDEQGRTLDTEDTFDRLCSLSRGIMQSGQRQFLCGNGASAAFASHMASDWTKNAGLPTHCFSDHAILTAVVNDVGPEAMFALPLRSYARPGDLLVTISSSGNSPNIIAALQEAGRIGMPRVTLSGLKPDNSSRQYGDINLYVPAKSYGIVECAHQVLLHAWIDAYMDIEEWNLSTEQDLSPRQGL